MSAQPKASVLQQFSISQVWSPGFSRLARENRLKPGLRARRERRDVQNENCCQFREAVADEIARARQPAMVKAGVTGRTATLEDRSSATPTSVDMARVIRRSVRCLGFGLIGTIPRVGLGLAWQAIHLGRKVRAEIGER